MMKRNFYLIPVTLALLMAACSSPVNPASTGTPAGSADAYPYPYPVEDAYPAPSNEREVFEANLTPIAPDPGFSETTGAFKVQLFYPDGQRPVRGQIFFAAEMLPVEGIDGFIPKLDSAVAPSGASDSQGTVVISDMEPGSYALTLMTPLGPILVELADSQDAILFEISANQVTDLGALSIGLDPEAMEP